MSKKVGRWNAYGTHTLQPHNVKDITMGSIVRAPKILPGSLDYIWYSLVLRPMESFSEGQDARGRHTVGLGCLGVLLESCGRHTGQWVPARKSDRLRLMPSTCSGWAMGARRGSGGAAMEGIRCRGQGVEGIRCRRGGFLAGDCESVQKISKIQISRALERIRPSCDDVRVLGQGVI